MTNDDAKRALEKLDKVAEHLASIDVTLAKQQVSLDEHIRRTALAEKAIERVAESVKPVQKHVTQVEGVLKFIGLLSLIAGLLVSILKINGLL